MTDNVQGKQNEYNIFLIFIVLYTIVKHKIKIK